MGKLKDKSLDDILNRSVAEKILAVEKIWDSIEEESHFGETPSEFEKTLIKERLALYKKNPGKLNKCEDVKGNYLKKK
jgi:putative addiction module component (TIGR02574 family)